MKLTELFPDNPKIKLNDKEYKLKFNTRAMFDLEKNYDEPEKILNIANGFKWNDIINFIHAGLQGIKVNMNKEEILDSLDVKKFNEYKTILLASFCNSLLTKEQIDKLEVIAEQAKDNKKKAVKKE